MSNEKDEALREAFEKVYGRRHNDPTGIQNRGDREYDAALKLFRQGVAWSRSQPSAPPNDAERELLQRIDAALDRAYCPDCNVLDALLHEASAAIAKYNEGGGE